MTNTNKNSNKQLRELSPGEKQGDNEVEKAAKSDSNSFIGKDKLLQQFKVQLKQFQEWYDQRDWLAFHNHHYDWWMFPIDEISSRGSEFQLPKDVIQELREDQRFISDLRLGVRLMVSSWGWDIDKAKFFDRRDDKQKWSYWPVRLYKAGKCMWLFNQMDYYQSLKELAIDVKEYQREKLDYFSHTKNGKANVLEQWREMEHK